MGVFKNGSVITKGCKRGGDAAAMGDKDLCRAEFASENCGIMGSEVLCGLNCGEASIERVFLAAVPVPVFPAFSVLPVFPVGVVCEEGLPPGGCGERETRVPAEVADAFENCRDANEALGLSCKEGGANHMGAIL
jgi:hypothetical protein